MSRTDKDKPYWVRTEWYKPWHRCGWHRCRKYVDTDEMWPWGKPKREFIGYRWEYRGDCDLPETPIRKPNRVNRRPNLEQLCSWEAEWPFDFYTQTRGVPNKRFWRRKEFYGPQRMNERRASREIIKGNREVEFPDGRGRHSVLWDMS